MESQAIYDTLNAAYFSDTPHEAEAVRHVHQLVKDGAVVADIGASLGQYTKAICDAVQDAAIHAIEADPIRVAELERNARKWANESGNAITIHAGAANDRDGELTFYVTNSDVSGGLNKHATPRPVEWDAVTVQAFTLDTLFPRRVPNLVKIDVEGAELAVLQGAERILRARRTTFLVELHDWPAGRRAETIAFMQARGYRCAPFYGQTVFTRSLVLWIRLAVVAVLHDPRLLLPR